MRPPPFDPQALLSAIVTWSDDAIVSKDTNGTITSWNKGAERIFGYSADEAVGQSIRIIIPKDRHAEEDDVLARIRRGEAVHHFETIRQRKDGSLVPISLTISPVRDANGVVIGASKIARDISQRRTAEAALAQAHSVQADLQRRLLTLVAASGSLLESPRVADVIPATLSLARQLIAADGYAVWRLDPASGKWGVGAHSGVSENFAASLIAQQRPATGATVPFNEPMVYEDVLTAPMLEERREAYAQEGITSMLALPLLIRGEATGALVFYHRQPHAFDEVEVQAARALSNLVAAAITTAELYTEQQRSHEQATFLARAGAALASSLDYAGTLRTVAEMAVPAIADWCAVDLVNEQGRPERLAVAHVDPAKVEYARTLQERYPEDPNADYSVSRAIRTGRPIMLEHLTDEMIVARARSEQHLSDVRALNISSFMIVPLIAHGRTLGALTFVAADSGRRYNSSDLNFAQELALRAALAVDNARAYQEVRHVNRLKDDFLATLSHELRTPLNAILGYSRMLRTGILSGDKQTRAVQVVERSAASLTQIVEDVLDVSRIISGKMRLNIQPMQLPIVINDAIATVLPAAEAKGIEVVTSIDPLPGQIVGDPDRLQQVVWNLVSNAVKFTPRGGRVAVHVERAEGQVQIEVADTGIGFQPEFAPHLFERFRQADSGFAREHGGLGLGLAIARHLVEMHGGTIDARSEGPGRGATFRIVLPVAAAAERVREVEARTAHEQSQFEASMLAGLGGLSVLAVDDDPDALALVKEILEAAGAEVTTAPSADAALDEIARERPDALVADLGMPGVDGFELIHRLRRSSDVRARALPAIALTAYARSEDRARALRDGFQMHLAKPIDPAELVAAISSLTKQSGERA